MVFWMYASMFILNQNPTYMTNFYWPIYKNIESEFNKLMFDIHIDDNQLGVYSTRISDLILRVVTEIESLSKELYTINDGIPPKSGFLKYDEDCLKYLDKVYNLTEKNVNIISINCYLSDGKKVLKPFAKNTPRLNKKLTYSWNHAYQSIKHNRAENIKQGCIGNFFDALAALFLLNICYKDNVYKFSNSDDIDLDLSQGSEIFSILFHIGSGLPKPDGTFLKNDQFYQSTYHLKVTDASFAIALNNYKKQVGNIRTLKHAHFNLYSENKQSNSRELTSYDQAIEKLTLSSIFFKYEAVIHKEQ